MNRAALFCLFCLLLNFCRWAGAEEMIIKLKDGVVMRGEIVSMHDGVYTVKSGILGILSVKSEDVVSITNLSASCAQAPDSKEIERRILNDPGLMACVKNLAHDQSIIEMLSDPQLKSAIMRQDFDYLKNNEKFIKVMNNAAVQSIVQNVAPHSGNSDERD